MNNDEKLVKSLNRRSSRLLKDAMASIDFTKKVRPIVDEEDGEVYYAIEPGCRLKKHHIETVDAALIECAKMYQAAEVSNNSKFYRKIARMVHYALYELESREMLENQVIKEIADVE